MGETKSEAIFNVAKSFVNHFAEVPDALNKKEIKEKLERLFELASEIEKHEKDLGDIEKEANKTAKSLFEYWDIDEKDLAGMEFAKNTGDKKQKLEYLEDTISAHLKRAKELLIEKGKLKAKHFGEKSKSIIEEMSDKINSMYNSSIDFVNQKKEENKAKIAAKKEEKRQMKEKAIEQLKALGKDDEYIKMIDTEGIEIADELVASYERQDELEANIKSIKKNSKALMKYEKKGFFSRFLSNFSELGQTENLSDEQRKEMLANGGAPKKQTFFSKVKQAFSKTREQGKEIHGKNEELKEEIMQKFEKELEDKNKEISELENLLAENDEQKEHLEAEKKEKLVEIVKTGKLKAKELQEMIDNEILICSNPKMIVAKAKVSALKDKLSRVLSWDKEQEEEKTVEKETSRNSGMDR